MSKLRASFMDYDNIKHIPVRTSIGRMTVWATAVRLCNSLEMDSQFVLCEPDYQSTYDYARRWAYQCDSLREQLAWKQLFAWEHQFVKPPLKGYNYGEEVRALTKLRIKMHLDVEPNTAMNRYAVY